MYSIFLFSILELILLIVPISAHSLEKGKWTFVKDDDWCYIGSLPLKTDLPENMQKKYKMAEYKREKFLAKKYVREVLNQTINESKLRELIQRLVTEQTK